MRYQEVLQRGRSSTAQTSRWHPARGSLIYSASGCCSLSWSALAATRRSSRISRVVFLVFFGAAVALGSEVFAPNKNLWSLSARLVAIGSNPPVLVRYKISAPFWRAALDHVDEGDPLRGELHVSVFSRSSGLRGERERALGRVKPVFIVRNMIESEGLTICIT